MATQLWTLLTTFLVEAVRIFGIGPRNKLLSLFSEGSRQRPRFGFLVSVPIVNLLCPGSEGANEQTVPRILPAILVTADEVLMF